MKNIYVLLPVLVILIFGSCKTVTNSVSFVNKRTPLNPIAHRGVTHYQVVAELMYAQAVEQELIAYQNEVARRQDEYRKAMEEYNSKTAAERIVLNIQKPELVLPDRPFVPFMYDERDLASRVSIAGMERGDVNPLHIRLEYMGFEEQAPKLNTTTKKRKKDDVEYIDTNYHYTVGVRHPLIIRASAPNGEKYEVSVAAANRWKTLKGKSFSDSARAFNSMIDAIEEEEKKIAFANTNEANKILNSQFGTKDVNYTVRLYTFKSSRKHDYSDLDNALNIAQYGLSVLNQDRNDGVDNINQAFIIWREATKEYGVRRGRIDDKVMKGILKNLIVAATFTENWEEGLRYIIQLENMKLKGSDRSELRGLKIRFNDLKSRYDALKKE